MNYKPMQSTTIYSFLREPINSTVQKLSGDGTILLSQKELEEQFLMIKNYVNSPLKNKIMNELNQKTMRLIYSQDTGLSYIPFILRGDRNTGRVQSVDVVVSAYGNMKENGTVNIEYRKLYTLMESAYLAKNFLLRYDRYRNNNALIAQGSLLYANMFIKPINKRYNLNVDRERENKVLFLAAKFYLKNVLGIQNEEIIFNTAMKACKGGNPHILQEVNMIVGEESFVNVASFIESLKTDALHLGLNDLQVRGYLDTFIQLYGQSTIFALELIPYFIFVGNAALNSMGLVNNYNLESIMEKGMAKILAQLYM